MLDWKILAVVGPIFFASYQALTKLIPKGTSVFLVNAYASFVGLIFMLILHLVLSHEKSLLLRPKTLIIAIVVGLLISLGNFSIIKAYGLGAPQSIFSLIFYVILIAYGVLLGLLMWQESFSIPQIFGAVLSVVGILIIVYYKK